MLADCPHCGGKAKEKILIKPFRHGWVGCPNCRCYISWSYDDAAAIERWNSRVPAAENAVGESGIVCIDVSRCG